MTTNTQIKRQKQKLERLLDRLTMISTLERKRDTRKKIELGGLCVKAHADTFPKNVILGLLVDAVDKIQSDPSYETYFASIGQAAFLNTKSASQEK